MLGTVYFWNTDKADGHEWRWKYHVYLGEADWPDEGRVFLFINKSDYGGDFRIEKKDYDFLSLDHSFIGCGSRVIYSDAEIKAAGAQHKGCISKEHLRQLYSAVAASETMERRQIKQVCALLKAAFD